MSFDKAIEILTDELCHIRHHLLEKGKAPEYYAELRQLVTALEMGISALAKELPKEPPAPICQTCRNFETCPWRHEGVFSGPPYKARRVFACSEYKTE